jgi:serine/threonine-protein kinase
MRQVKAANSKNRPSIGTFDSDRFIGENVGTSTILKELGRGNMAIIFVAYQRTLKRQIAVKVLPKLIVTPLMAERFQQEAEAAAILSHPNIVTIYEVGETDEFLFITMQLIKGRSLFEYMKMARKHPVPSKRILPIKTTINIITDVIGALDYAHEQKIIHRDIKPANILIEAHTNRPIISDFGLATLVSEVAEDTSTIMGTPLYMAPEQILNEPASVRTDIYAIGIMLFQMLVSELPVPKYETPRDLLEMKLKLKERFFQKMPSEMNPLLNPETDKIVFKALSHDPERRYTTCSELLDALVVYRDCHLRNLS